MNQEGEASSSSQPPPENIKAKHVETLLKDCKKLREQVESVKNVHTITFYSRLVSTAYESIKTIISKFHTTYPTWVDDIKACEYYRQITCDLGKEIKAMFVNAVMTRSPTSNRGVDSRKIPMWKKQCDKNMEKIESLIRDTILLGDDSTWFDEFWLFGIFHGGVSGILVILRKIMMMKETKDDDDFKLFAEGCFERFEMCFRDYIYGMLEKVREGVKELADLKKLQDDEALKKIQEEEALNELQIVEETQRKLQIDEEKKSLAEEEALKNLQEEDKEEPLKELQEEEEKEELQEKEALKKSQEEESQKNSQETEVNKKSQDEEEEAAALKKSQEDENTDDEIFRFGTFTFRMKNGVLERIFD